MANPIKILLISGEVAPFASGSMMADLVRLLPEKLQESGDYELRIMMPRYGIISERRNRLHEVIRLSGTEVPMGPDKETLKVKVASIPGIRLQVYFMDNNRYFKRKGVFTDKQGKVFSDNIERALFFARSTLETIRNLGWSPDVVHAFGSMSALVPLVLRSEYASDALFENAKVVYTPGNGELGHRLTSDLVATLKLTGVGDLVGQELSDVGSRIADAVILPPSGASGDHPVFSLNGDEVKEVAMAVYDQVLNGVTA
jgi:starch synthase